MIQTKGDKLRKKCCDDVSEIEHYQEAISSPKRWCCHHRLETHTSDGFLRAVFLSKEELEALGMYWNRPASELIFMEWSEHQKLHCSDINVRKHHSGAQRGEKNHMYGRKRTLEETEKRRTPYISEDGQYFNSLTELARFLGIPTTSIYKYKKDNQIVYENITYRRTK
jgi:hypothetical protein